MEFTSKTVIEQTHFVETADAILAGAMNPESDIVEALEDVSKLATTLSEIKAGSIHIEPPLDSEDVTSYQERTDQIMSLGKRTVEALDDANASRKGRITSLFKGIGLASKR